MGFDLSIVFGELAIKSAAEDILRCSSITEKYGITISARQAAELAAVRSKALRTVGRVEFGAGVAEKLIKAFCDSPYLNERSFTEKLGELIEMFYIYKNETLDLVSDDDLIEYMRRAFDGVCQGSAELLGGTVLAELAEDCRRNGRFNSDMLTSPLLLGKENLFEGGSDD